VSKRFLLTVKKRAQPGAFALPVRARFLNKILQKENSTGHKDSLQIIVLTITFYPIQQQIAASRPGEA
jgi:hypothetical protein